MTAHFANPSSAEFELPAAPQPAIIVSRSTRLHAAAPALAASQTLRMALIGFCIVLTSIAVMNGTTLPAISSLFIGAVVLTLSLLDARQAPAQVHAAAQGLESLADRMWELQETEERFRGLNDALGDLVIHRDREGRIVYANGVFRTVVGKPEADIIGRRLADLGVEIGMVPDAAFQDGECLSSTDVAVQTPGGTRWFSWIELSMRDWSSKQVSHRAIARDITARKRAETALISARERAEYASSAKSRFLATVSHEIRTPMNGIMGMTKLLADTSLTGEQRTYVNAVSTSASALLALIDDLLDFSRIEAGRFAPEPQPVSPRELVEGVVELLAARAYGKDIGLASHVASDVPQSVVADPGRMRQVLLNLVGNAIKFTSNGGILVSVSLAGTMLRFSVADTGIGLKPEDCARIFEEFEQADGSSTRSHAGAGLGLAISRRIVEALGGKITVSSDPGLGSEFAFEIPVVGATSHGTQRDRALEGHRSLILSRNEVESEAIARAIRAHGGTAEIAFAIDQAEAMAGPFDAILVDAGLESAEGRTLARLSNLGPGAARPVIMIAPTDRGSLGAYRASGYATFLARPVRGDTLLRVLLSGISGATLPADSAASRPGRAAQRASKINAMLARSCLQKAGHRVEVVTNGKAAVEAVTAGGGRHRYDVVLMDLHMPVMDGLEAITLIRRNEEEAELDPMPILVLSADGQESTRHRVLAHGASGIVTKPMDPDQLVQVVEAQIA